MVHSSQRSGHSTLKNGAGQMLRSTDMQSRPAAALALPRPPAILQQSMQSLQRPRHAQQWLRRLKPAPLPCPSMWRRHALESLPLHLPRHFTNLL